MADRAAACSRQKVFWPLLQERLVILDGARHDDSATRLEARRNSGERFAAWRSDLRGNKGPVVDHTTRHHRGHSSRVSARGCGCDLTNTFNSNAVSQSD